MTCQDIDTSIQEVLFEDSAILAITDKLYTYPISQDSNTEIQRMYFENAINYLEITTERSLQRLELGGADSPEYTYLISLRYTKERNIDGTDFNSIRDNINTIIDRFLLLLGDTLDDNADFLRFQSEPPAIRLDTVNDDLVYRAIYEILAIKQT